MTKTNRIPNYPDPSQHSRELMSIGERYLMQNYKQKEIVLARGRGARVWDSDGNEYIDLGSGISVTSLGHGDAQLLAAFTEQGERLWHASNIYFCEPSIRLAEELVESAAHFAQRAFFCNSGGEANEAAIKIARKTASLKHPPSKREIISFEGGFHGRTIATVTATAQPKFHEGFEPLPAGFRYCPFNDFAAIEQMVDDNTCAIIVEPIQGESGVNPAEPGFLRHLRTLCDRVDALLICDEIQTGMGRTGKLFTHQWEEGIKPDVVTLAKALGGGLPIAAVLAGERAAETLQPGSHGTTFGGNAVACAVARVMWRRINNPELLANVERQGAKLVALLQRFQGADGLFTEVRGRGLMIGAQLGKAWSGRAGELTDKLQRRGVLTLVAGANDVLRLLPALNINDEETDIAIERLQAGLTEAADNA